MTIVLKCEHSTIVPFFGALKQLRCNSKLTKNIQLNATTDPGVLPKPGLSFTVHFNQT
jgi:hypothetical protein